MEDIISMFGSTAEKVEKAIADFSGSNLNRAPFEGSWTAARVADHIFKSQATFPKLLSGTSAETTRDPEAGKENLKHIFLDMSNKMKSPDFILPTNEPLEKELLIDRIVESKNKIIAAMNAHDLRRTYLDFKLPGFEAFTGLEWGRFTVYHTERHVKQPEAILKVCAD